MKNKDYSFRKTWMTSEWLERRRIWLPCGRIWWKRVDLGEPKSFLDHVYMGCTQRECKPNEIILDQNTRKCSNHKFLLEELKNNQGGGNLTQKLSRGPTTWKVRSKNAMKDLANWRIKRQNSYYKKSSPCLDDHHFKEEELESVGELLKSMHTYCPEMLVLGTTW